MVPLSCPGGVPLPWRYLCSVWGGGGTAVLVEVNATLNRRSVKTLNHSRKRSVLTGDQIDVSKSIHSKYRPMTVASKQYFTQQDQRSRLSTDSDQVSWSGVSYEMAGGRHSAAGRTGIPQKYPAFLNEILKNQHQML